MRFRLGQSAPTVSPVTQQFVAQAQASYSNASASVKAQIDAQTGSAQNTQRISDGTQAATSLVQNGYDPNSTDDNGKVVAMLAGGLTALGPATAGATVLVAGGLEALWQVGNAIACPVVDAFASIGLGPPCGAPACKSSGNWTTAGVMQSSNKPASMAPGSFAAFVTPALAYYAAISGNCQQSYPPDVVVDGAVAAWNQTHSGPPVEIFVPALERLGLIYAPGTTSGCDALGQSCNVNTAITYAFVPNSSTPWGKLGGSMPYQNGSGVGQASQPRTVSINSGALITKTTVGSVAGAVVKHTGIAVSGAVVGGLFYAWVTGKAVDKVFSGAWDAVRGGIMGGLNSLEHFGALREKNPLEARKSTTVETLLFTRPRYSTSKAVSWARGHGYRASKVDVTQRYVRIRQQDPDRFARGSMRTITFGKGVRAVIGHLREAS